MKQPGEALENCSLNYKHIINSSNVLQETVSYRIEVDLFQAGIFYCSIPISILKPVKF